MQNIASSARKVKATFEETLESDAAIKRPSSLDDLPKDSEETATQDGLQSAPETSAKAKTRSRFSAAIRKLSKPRRKKKDKSTAKARTSPERAEVVVSSGAEESAENVKAKKASKLSKRFLLGGLKRAKSGPKKDSVEKEELPPVSTLSQTTSTDELITLCGAKESLPAAPKETRPSLVSDLVASGGLQRLDRTRRVQITIRGKKVEPAQSSDDVRRQAFLAQAAATKAAEELQQEPTERDYLAPTEDTSSGTRQVEPRDVSPSPASSSSSHSTEADLSKAKKKKLKSKKLCTTAATTAARCKATHAIRSPSPAPPQTTASEEKFVVTESRRDTPPRERAPAKPSRVAVSPTSRTPASTGATRKPSTRVAPSLYEPRTTAKGLEESSALLPATETESDLMQSPNQGAIERGHRFPRPTSPTAAAIEPNAAAVGNETPEPAAATTNTSARTATNPQQRQRQIKFQLQSEASQNPSRSPSPPTATDGSSAEPAATSEASESRSRSLLPSEQLYLATRILPRVVKSVAAAHRSDPDEPDFSSAESAQHHEQALDSSEGVVIDSRYSGGYALSQDSASTLRAEDSVDSSKSSASQSPVGESSRRRIRYVAQPTLYDEDERVESRREALSYLFAGASDYSVDSDQDGDRQMPAFGDLTMEQMEPPIMTSSAEKREHLYKILVIGELGTGKTSFIKRYVHQFFSQNYRATIGVDFALKVLHWDASTIVRLQLWDIAGQERFGNMTRVYYKEAVGAFIVFDVTRSGTFDCVSKWKDDLDSKVQLPDGSPIPCILLANKCDQDKQGIVATPEKIDEYVRENGFAGWFETSAKENINIDEAARALVNKILLNDKLISDADLADSEGFSLNTADPTTLESKGKCSC